MRTILVTGANKGIGFAIAKGVVIEYDDTFLLLGSRDRARGEEALQALSALHPSSVDRARVVEIDVASDESVAAAAGVVREHLGADGSLYGVVNNAGVGAGEMKTVLNVNTVGVHRVCETFLPHIDADGGRIVTVTSASGPIFVADCSDERKRFFLDATTGWSDLETLMAECLSLEAGSPAFAERGWGGGDAYGFSKACTNTYVLQLARRYPKLAVNACTPGFIETDMTRHYATSRGKTPADLGMKTPEDGARSALFLLFADLEGNGRYYGSDCQRSPLDRYRGAGDPPYTGD